MYLLLLAMNKSAVITVASVKVVTFSYWMLICLCWILSWVNWRASCSGGSVESFCNTHAAYECNVFTSNFLVRLLVLYWYVTELSTVPSETVSLKLYILYRKLCGWCELQPYSPRVSFRHGICSGWRWIPVATLDCIPLCHLHLFKMSFHISQPCLLTLVTTTRNSSFTPVCFTPFCLKALCRCTPLLNMHFLV